ncbi:beta-ketoacyl-[acyl-carrier-protein] synthase family protein [Desulforamulus ruminis]|uniref:Beta-ketoacyl synthase n=1 Tax=Desulforamulus ruminis (strain ATCC 23193 / DSM 2154 / NCIMB 8452 / DL) TaxID=696281 RepID=F6DKS9_DESRL|nr:beta-ketoacyl-[acyl-carrier-protein] synthase family protein [Desulforamulus ruminis]AEG60454.1 Beta-ketoacyl synthase [Desulforamulus ruminis DSM 2154]
MKQRKVVVTGIGVVSPLGTTVPEFWGNLTKGVSAIERISRFDPDCFRCQVAGQIRDFQIERYFKRRDVQNIDLAIQYALAAAKMALADAEIREEQIVREEWGVILGQTVGGALTGEKVLNEQQLFQNHNLYLNCVMESNLYWFANVFGFSGYASMISTGCAAGTDAIGCGFHKIREGFMDIAVVGGMEAPIAPLTLASFDVIGGLAKNNQYPQRASCPFSVERDGFVPAEGAGILILEELEHARQRGAKIYGEIKGYGNNSNAYHMTAPLPEGERLGEVIQEAIMDAGIEKEEIGYINAHGSSTPLNDIAETKAIKYALSEHAYQVSISSNKSIMGHPLGAAGALEFITVILSVNSGMIPPTINLDHPDPECDLDYTPNQCKCRKIKHAMSISSGFGGVNCSLVFSKYA